MAGTIAQASSVSKSGFGHAELATCEGSIPAAGNEVFSGHFENSSLVMRHKLWERSTCWTEKLRCLSNC